MRSQAALGELLASVGFEVNQATLSRDLRELGLVKGVDGYQLPGPAAPARNGGARLHQAASQWLDAAVAVQNQVVLRTPPGGAQPLALALDGAPPDVFTGTLAGDDTILVICKNGRDARGVAASLQQLTGRKEPRT